MDQITFLHASNTTTHIIQCAHVMNLNFQDRCNFIRTTEGCLKNLHYFDYLNFIFCDVGATSKNNYFSALFIVFIICLYMFITLGTTADKFFCPALAVISKLFGLSENLSGITLMAFGNGAPDIFTSLFNTEDDTELMYTQLLGGAVYVTGFIIGIIMLIYPFNLPKKNYIRDVIFFIISVTFIHNSMHDEFYALNEGIMTICIYLLYLIVVIVQHLLMKKKIRDLKNSSRRSSNSTESEAMMKLAEEMENFTNIQIRNRRDTTVILNNDIWKVFRRKPDGNPNKDLFIKFIHDINPIKRIDWNESSFLGTIFIIIKAPIVFILSFIIPLVDYGEDLHGWSKLLNMINVITLPQVALLVLGIFKQKIFIYIPLPIIILVISIAIDVAIYKTSRNDRPPKYHVIFAAGSFAGSILVIYSVAKEVVSVMTTVAIISDMSDSMVGLSVLAWGNNIGDTFATIALAKQGYQQMAFAACFGGPMLNILLGIGITFIMKGLKSLSNTAHARGGALGPNCIIFLISILSFTFFALLLTNFRTRKSIGYFCIIMYATFLLYCLLGEFEIMHPYGTDHRET
ncbi:hypothetical protein PVAND_006888 [Polypedilum vanderplanki]|uniref:Sodium/calcium exchanger membrane region domain-containing protein n=1 Tax=Polypedilum vanderplanki TaxID=319348 RepID=A0A9J6C4N7_POLVA|nr:hypothetical protein PVAND_006888 [Polypedilum vanderplanki]